MIIALLGFAGSGKSTIASYLVEKHGFVRVSFAGPVKDTAAQVFGWTRAKLEGIRTEDREWRETPDPFWTDVKGAPFSPRAGLQLIGNGFRELFHKDIWVGRAVQIIKALPPHKNIVVDDMRYVNERFALEALGAKTFIVKRPGFPSAEHQRVWDLGFTGNGIPDSPLPLSEWDWLRHPSIADLSTPVISNDKDIQALYNLIEQVYNELRVHTNNDPDYF